MITKNSTARINGSSPRVRGTPVSRTTWEAIQRFIPASAGNTLGVLRFSFTAPVHPRECGEHVLHQRIAKTSFGSSPRVRGTRWTTCSRSRRSSVHPRECGEHFSFRHTFNSVGGSSPRVRGTLPAASARRKCARFIPASAGNTQVPSVRRASQPVHPRECGEHAAHNASLVTLLGSSPRVRGTQQLVNTGGESLRFIPASAGNTQQEQDQEEQNSVHPRECGEHAVPSSRVR